MYITKHATNMILCAFHFVKVFKIAEIKSSYYLHVHSGMKFFDQILKLWSKFWYKNFDNPMLQIWNICKHTSQDYSLLDIYDSAKSLAKYEAET